MFFHCKHQSLYFFLKTFWT